MLEVGVHNDDVVALSVAEAGVHTGLLAEIPREGDISHPLVLVGQRPEDLQGPVLGAVVYEEELKGELRPLGGHAVGDLSYLIVEHGEDLLLIVTRNDYRNEFHTTPPNINKYTTNYTTIRERLQEEFTEFPKNLHKKQGSAL